MSQPAGTATARTKPWRRSNLPTPQHQPPAELICSALTLKLAAAKLAESGLTLDDASAAGIFPTDDASTINPDFAPKPALIFCYRDARGQPMTFVRDGTTLPYGRARYLVPPGFPLPKSRKYDQPANSGTPPYFPSSVNWHAVEKGEVEALCLTEGELKAEAMSRAGLPTIAIAGVYNFAEGSAALHSALAGVLSKCKDTYIVFDSDALTNPDIQAAEWRLAGQLALLGCRVHTVRLPLSTEVDAAGKPRKVGADDFITAHGADALHKLVIETPALGERSSSDASTNQITIADILKHSVSPVEELIPGWIEKGIPNFLCGAGGVHKSRLAMQWGLCVNAGASVWGLEPGLEGMRKPKASLVYVSAEDDANELARRAQAICAALKLKSPPQGLFIPRRGLDSALVLMHESAEVELRPFYYELTSALRSIPGHKLLVLDSAYDFVRFVGRAKIDEDSVNYYIKVLLQGICDQCDATLLIPWHPSQAGSERENMDGWSVAWHNGPRLRISLKAVKDTPDTYELAIAKRNHGRKGEPIQIRYCDGALLPLNVIPDDGKATAFHQVVVSATMSAALAGVPCNRRHVNDQVYVEAAKALGRRPSPKEVMRALERAVQAGELIFLPFTSKRAAGFYPPDKEAAIALSLATRRAGKPGTGE